MKLLFYFYCCLFCYSFSVKAANSSISDRYLPMPVVVSSTDSIIKTVPKVDVKTTVPGVISLLSSITAVILIFAGATVGAIIFGGIAILAGMIGKSMIRKLIKEKQKVSPSTSSKVKAGGAAFGIIVGILAIIVALAVFFFNAITSWGG